MSIRRIKGQKLTTPAGVGSQSTEFRVTEADGTIVGIAVGENYSRADLGQMLLTVEANGEKQVINLPLTSLLPDGERYYLPLPVGLPVGTLVVATIESASANSVAANPVVLILYFTKD